MEEKLYQALKNLVETNPLIYYEKLRSKHIQLLFEYEHSKGKQK